MYGKAPPEISKPDPERVEGAPFNVNPLNAEFPLALNVVNAPADPSNAGAPVDPLLTAKAVAMPVPRPETPVLMGRPVQLDSVPLEGVPRMGVVSVGLVSVLLVSVSVVALP